MRGLAEVSGLHGDHRDVVLAKLLPQHRRSALHSVLEESEGLLEGCYDSGTGMDSGIGF